MAAIVEGMIRFFLSQVQLEGHVARRAPVEAVRHVLSHPPPLPMYNDHGFGGYLIFALDGRNKVFIDGRTDIYDQVGVLTDYGRIGRVEPIALRLLDAYSVQSCLIERNEALGTLLAASPRWQKVYADDQSVLFVRKVNRNEPNNEGSSACIRRSAQFLYSGTKATGGPSVARIQKRHNHLPNGAAASGLRKCRSSPNLARNADFQPALEPRRWRRYDQIRTAPKCA